LNVPFFNLLRQYEALRSEIEAAVLEVMASGSYIEGSAVSAFEREMAAYLGVNHVISCGSGTAALELALKACGVGRGDEVITTAFSFFASAEAISAVGATPVFADILEDGFTVDPLKIKEKITERTKAVLPVHIFGMPAEMDEINAIAKENHLPVIEDACQAIGASYHGAKTGSLGDIAAFSFYPTKNLGGAGDGGMITTNDDSLAVICRALKAHAGGKTGYEAAALLGESAGLSGENSDAGLSGLSGLSGIGGKASEFYDPYKYYNYLIADNSRLDSIQAAVLRVKLKHLDTYNQKRSLIAAQYNEGLANQALSLPRVKEDGSVEHGWHQYAVLTDSKDDLIDHLSSKGIGAGSFYPVPLHLQKAFSFLGYAAGDCPVAESVCSRSVCLPIFPELTPQEQEQVIEAVNGFGRS